MTEGETRRNEGAPSIGIDDVRVTVVGPGLWFSPLDAVGHLRVEDFARAALEQDDGGSPGEGGFGDRFPRASLLVCNDAAAQFHPDLSIREPLEVQVWPGGELGFEVEFVGLDVRDLTSTWDVMEGVLRSWAEAQGVQLVALGNDRGRSLPDVWNARFELRDGRRSIAEVVELAQRAIRVAEFRRYGGESLEDLQQILRSGDAHALLALDQTALVQMRASLPAGEHDLTKVASDVCAFANSAHGGVIVFGMTDEDPTEPGARMLPVAPGHELRTLEASVRSVLFPPPVGLSLEPVSVAGFEEQGQLVLLVVPPQDRVLQPFFLHGTLQAADNTSQFLSIVERRGSDTHVVHAASLHATLQAGRAFLLGDRR